MKLIPRLLLSAFALLPIITISQPSLAIKHDLKTKHGLSVGDKVIPFDLYTETDKLMKFEENYKGKVLLLVLCNYCNKDLAGSWTIQSFYKYSKYKDFQYTVVFSRRCLPGFIPSMFVAKSAHDTAVQVRIPYFLMDWDEDVFEKYKGSLDDPHIYVVDKSGTIKFKQILKTPFISTDPMNRAIENALSIDKE